MEETPAELKEAVSFHGHLCPGLTIGYRVANLARKKLGLTRSEDEELVVIVENDSCAVDAVQYLTGATFGKGNLIFKDHGLHAYTFIERNSGKQVRIELNADVFLDKSKEMRDIQKKMNENLPISNEERAILQNFRNKMIERMLSAPEEELFNVKDVAIEVPERARIFSSLKCSKCGLMVMETRVRVKNEKFYCIPCWKKELGTN